jgi:hypothetical protein
MARRISKRGVAALGERHHAALSIVLRFAGAVGAELDIQLWHVS